MTPVRTTFVVGLGLALGGCQMPQLTKLTRMFETARPAAVKPLEDGSFQVELDPSQVKGLGGPRSATLESHVDQEVTKSGLCKGGIRIESEWWGNGYYGIKGRCK
jgi:hypothetical protein